LVVRYNRGDGIIHIIVRDETGAKIEQFRCNLKDNNRFISFLNYLSEKYGIDFREKGIFEF